MGIKRPVLEKRDYSVDALCERIRQEINKVLSVQDTGKTSGRRIFGSGRVFPEKELQEQRVRARLRQAARTACFQNIGEREYLKSYIREILISRLHITPANICRVIPFDRTADMSARDMFEYMYSMYSERYGRHAMKRMFRDMGWDKKHASGDRTAYIDEEDVFDAYTMCQYPGDYNDRLNTVVERCYSQMYGHDCADILISDMSVDGVSGGTGGRTRSEYDFMEELQCGGDSGLTESMNTDVVFVVLDGKLFRMKFLSFGSVERLSRVVKNIVRCNAKEVLSVKNPVVCGTLADNSRVVAARPPVSDGWSFYVRKFAGTRAKDLPQLIIHDNAEPVIALLRMIPGAELNFVVSGNTGGGKTTLVKALVRYIDPGYCIRVVETGFELGINNLYPERNIHVLQERGDFSIYDAITATKKMDTDVILIGEINEPGLAGAYIQVAQSGSRMAITTLHHETTQSLIEYMRNALVSECRMNDIRVAEQQVVEVLDLDIHMVHDTAGNHYIERITEILPLTLNGTTEETEKHSGDFGPKMTDRPQYVLRDLIVFDKRDMRYRVLSMPSEKILNRIREKLGEDMERELELLFEDCMRKEEEGDSNGCGQERSSLVC